jgi:O-antigen/teichoic acid export membrane protein
VTPSNEQESGEPAGSSPPHDLKRKTARGALFSATAQLANFVFRTASMVILARLLTPADFGIVGMITACTGFLELFRDMGLSAATVQRQSIDRSQVSTLFWVNLVAGCSLAALCAIAAPFIARFYHEPRLFWPTIALGTGFAVNGAAIQHEAILTREMRFAAIAAIDTVSLLVSIGVGVALAIAGYGYWALVGMYAASPVVGLLGFWTVGRWIPGPPRRGVGVRQMLRYGGALTLNNLVLYVAFNVDKVLIGRFWGAVPLGIYGRAYQLISLPTHSLNSTIGQVAIPALSRLQNDCERLRNYFLKGYGLFLSLVMPLTVSCALFAEDIVQFFLGAKWSAVVPLFRLLAPTILTLALVHPIGWLLLAIGRPARGLQIALVSAPVVILAYVLGLGNGPAGVAAGFSISTTLLVVPLLIWATRGTPVTAADMFKTLFRPFLSILAAAAATLLLWRFVNLSGSVFVRLCLCNLLFFGVYGVLLGFALGQKDLYLGLLREIGVWPFTRRRDGRATSERPDSSEDYAARGRQNSSSDQGR